MLARTDGVESYQVTRRRLRPAVGGRRPAAAPPPTRVTLARRRRRPATVADELRDEFGKLSDAGEITFGGGGGGGSADQLAVVVQAADPEALAAATEQVRAAMAGTAGVVDVQQRARARARPAFDVTVDRPGGRPLRASPTRRSASSSPARCAAHRPARSPSTASARRGGAVPATTPATVEELRALPLGPIRRRHAGDRWTRSPTVQTRRRPGRRSTRIDGDRSVTVTGTATGSNLGATTAELTEEARRR